MARFDPDLLGQVVGISRGAEKSTQAPHRRLGLGDELVQGAPIACLGAQSNRGDSLHGISEAARRASPPRTNVTSCEVVTVVVSTGSSLPAAGEGTRTGTGGDLMVMQCSEARTLLSSVMDLQGIAPGDLDFGIYSVV